MGGVGGGLGDAGGGGALLNIVSRYSPSSEGEVVGDCFSRMVYGNPNALFFLAGGAGGRIGSRTGGTGGACGLGSRAGIGGFGESSAESARDKVRGEGSVQSSEASLVEGGRTGEHSGDS